MKKTVMMMMAAVALPCAFTANAATYYVSKLGSDANPGTDPNFPKLTIQSAVDNVPAGSVIVVGDGTYAPITTDNKLLTIQAQNPDMVTIDANKVNRCATLGTASSHISTKLIGIILINGNADHPNVTVQRNNAGGVYGGTLVDCQITACEASNYAGGAAYSQLENCTVSGNTADYGGGVVHCDVVGSSITGNTANDSGGGVYGGTLSRCLISGNHAVRDGGGVAYGTLNNCILSKNTAALYGGGSYNGILNNCTIAQNEAREFGGGSHGCKAQNSIYWNNICTDDITSRYDFHYTEMLCCRAGVMPTGTDNKGGNITGDPLFVNGASGNYALQSGSPCVNTGMTSAAPLPLDYYGNPRVSGAAVDMGAYELPLPSEPTGMWASKGTYATDIYVLWSSVPGATSYRVYRAESNVIGQASLVETCTVTYFTDTTVTPGKTYWYWVMASNSAGEGPISASVSGYRAIALTPLTGLTASVAYTDKVALSWDPVPGAVGYDVRRGTDSVLGNSTYIGQPTAASYDDTGATVGQTYYYWVRSFSYAETAPYYGPVQGMRAHTQLTVIYNANGGAVSPASAAVTNGLTYGTLPTPSLTGHTFVEWRLDGTGVNASTTVTATTNHTLVAAWTAHTYTVQFAAGTGGMGTMASQPFTYGVAQALTSNAFTRSGMYFGGWAPSGTTPVYADGQVVENLTATPNGNVTLTAIWQAQPADTVWYVRPNGSDTAAGTSWATAFQTISRAVTMAAAWNTIIVTNGTYAPIPSTGNKRVFIQSVNGAGETFIDGGGTARCALLGTQAADLNTSLTGFTLMNGYTTGSGGGSSYGTLNDCTLTNCTANTGGGGANYGRLNNCIIVDNVAANTGGGAVNAILTDCTLSGNRANTGGGASGGTLSFCTLSNNTARLNGGGASSSTLDDCTLADNTAASYGGGSHYGVLNRCILIANVATTNGGGAYMATLNNSLLTQNRAINGGGASGSTLNNCTVVGNVASTSHGGANGTLKNSIIWGNSLTNGTPNNYSNGSFTNCCTYPLPPSGTEAGNIAADPMFVNETDGDYRLQPKSPCINAGDGAYAVGVFDLDRNPRVIGVRVDMGAYERDTSGDGPVASDVTSLRIVEIAVGGVSGGARGITLMIEYEGVESLDGLTLGLRTWYALDGSSTLLTPAPVTDFRDGTAQMTVNVPDTETKAFFRIEMAE